MATYIAPPVVVDGETIISNNGVISAVVPNWLSTTTTTPPGNGGAFVVVASISGLTIDDFYLRWDPTAAQTGSCQVQIQILQNGSWVTIGTVSIDTMGTASRTVFGEWGYFITEVGGLAVTANSALTSSVQGVRARLAFSGTVSSLQVSTTLEAFGIGLVID